ncbi:aspartate-alanine antiporter [Pseudoxanthomonas indica]|uniref:Putative transport protein n=1 Tax=Pseudoxanthomonas indica TaxID=428993 RepID=A0A1T5K2M5_9GAMM|nr:aspartate-alanine antiporter [Pseudoxanthomonas indica]GGD46026.1 putative transporter [Pseudoxanthomonas indica]SKC57738.1 putative transport protein [Pseudoxanthomonas indica]
MQWITSMLARYPELAVYLALGIGYWVGNLRLRGFSLGGVTGSLLAGMLLGWLFEVPVSGAAKSLVFLLFLFGIGYEVGPRFLSAMKGDGWRFAALGIFMPLVGLLIAWLVARHLRLDPGLAAGMLSGALTESPAMGTASEAIQALTIDAATKERYLAHVGVGDALCYVSGALGVILTCTVFGPALLRIDLAAHALTLEARYGITRVRSGVASAWQPFETRAYRVAATARIIGLSIAQAERSMEGKRLFVHGIRRDGALLDLEATTVIQPEDVIAISGRREVLVDLVGARATEVEDPALLDIPMASHEVFVSKPGWAGRTLEELGECDEVRAVFLRRIHRNGQSIPIGTRTTLERGDVLQVVGPEAAVAGAAAQLGEIIHATDSTDFVVVGLAIFVGALLGAVIAVPIGSITVTIGTSVGALLAGLVIGHVRVRRPLFGRVPDAAVKFMQSFGLAAFVAMVGLGAGPHFLGAIRESGLGLFLGGIVVTMVPLLTGLWFGRKVLKIDPLLLLGAISGAQTFTAGLAALQEKSDSSIAVIGYTGSVAVAHVFLTTWGTVIVIAMS